MTVNPRRPITQRTANSLGQVTPVPGTGGSSKDTGKTSEQMTAELAVFRDQQPMLTTCAHCRKSFYGFAGHGREWFRDHLADQHPEVKLPRRSRSGRGWKKSSEADRAEAMVAVEARKAMLA